MMVGPRLEGLIGVHEGVRGREWVKCRPPHLGAIDAFLPAERMFVDGSGRDRSGRGGAGERGWAGGSHRRKSRRERETALAQQAVRVWGSAAPLCRVFPCARLLGRVSQGPDLCTTTSQGRQSRARETQADTPVVGLVQTPVQPWTKSHVGLGPPVLSLKIRTPD